MTQFDDALRKPATGPESTSADGIDVNELLARCMGNLQFAQRVVAKFHARLDDDLIELDKALAESNSGSVARLAHRIKGAAANVGAHGLFRQAATLEELALANEVADLANLLDGLRQEKSRFVKAAMDMGATAANYF